MGTNNKNSPSSERTFYNGSPSNKKYSSGSQQQQRPSPSKSINIKTPNKNQSSNVAGLTNNNKRLSGSCSPPNFSYFAASKCFESPSPQSLPKPPTSWFDEGKSNGSSKPLTMKSQRVRKSLNLSGENASSMTCAAEYAKHQQMSFASFNSNDHYTQNLKLLLNVSA
jgi:hypothetical protein